MTAPRRLARHPDRKIATLDWDARRTLPHLRYYSAVLTVSQDTTQLTTISSLTVHDLVRNKRRNATFLSLVCILCGRIRPLSEVVCLDFSAKMPGRGQEEDHVH